MALKFTKSGSSPPSVELTSVEVSMTLWAFGVVGASGFACTLAFARTTPLEFSVSVRDTSPSSWKEASVLGTPSFAAKSLREWPAFVSRTLLWCFWDRRCLVRSCSCLKRELHGGHQNSPSPVWGLLRFLKKYYTLIKSVIEQGTHLSFRSQSTQEFGLSTAPKLTTFGIIWSSPPSVEFMSLKVLLPLWPLGVVGAGEIAYTVASACTTPLESSVSVRGTSPWLWREAPMSGTPSFAAKSLREWPTFVSRIPVFLWCFWDCRCLIRSRSRPKRELHGGHQYFFSPVWVW